MKRNCMGVITVIAACFACMLWHSGCVLLNLDEPGNLVPKTVAEDPDLPGVDISGTRLHLETFGDPANPVVVFLHGGPGGDYRGMTRMCSLADQYYLVLFDQRSSGLSKRHDRSEISSALYVSDLDQIVDRYGAGRQVVLLGHSWGGQYAVMYASQHPNKVAKLVLIDPGPLTGADYSTYFSPKFVTDLTAPWISDFIWAEELISPDTHARLDYQKMLGAAHFCPEYNKSTTDPAPYWRLGAVASDALMRGEGGVGSAPQWDFTVGFDGFMGEVLFIRGGRNGVHTEQYMLHVMESYFAHTTCTFVTIPDAGHDQLWTKAEETTAAIRSFLK